MQAYHAGKRLADLEAAFAIRAFSGSQYQDIKSSLEKTVKWLIGTRSGFQAAHAPQLRPALDRFNRL